MKINAENIFDFRLAEIPYTSNYEYLQDWICFLDFKLSFYLTSVLNIQEGSDSKLDKYKGLVIGREEILDLLQEMEQHASPQSNSQATQSLSEEHEKFYDSLMMMEAHINSRSNVTIKKGVFLPFAYIVHMFALSSFEQHCIMISLLHHIDKKYEKIYGYLQDDVTLKYPTTDLAIKLYIPRKTGVRVTEFVHALEQRLFRYFFLDSQGTHSSLNRSLFLDKRIRDFIFDVQSIDELEERSMTLFFPDDDLPELVVQQEWQQQLRKQILQIKKPTICFIHGPSGSGKKLQIKTVASHVRKTVLFVKAQEIFRVNQTLNNTKLNKTIREVLLHDSYLCITDFDDVINADSLHEETNKEGKIELLVDDVLAELSGVIEVLFITSRTKWQRPNRSSGYRWMNLEISLLDRLERSVVWQECSKNDKLDRDIEIHALANKFRLTPGQISNGLQEAREVAEWQGVEVISKEIVYKACYSQVTHKLDAMASLVFAKYKMEDLILPGEQKKIIMNACAHVTYRHIVLDEWGFEEKLPYGKGLSMLFGGPPGTGKTMAAQVIANQLGLEMYKIDLSQIVSKYIGETEKNLQEVFNEAQKSNAILFFDECDSILGKRTEVKDAHDKYANIETSFLLQKIEEFEGVTVLATNLLSNIDGAFMRRIQYVIHFPFPDIASREQIWRSMYPDKAPVSSQVDYAFLAKQFELAGGNIKNIAVNAAFLAAAEGNEISMRHLISATKDELTKQGKAVVSSDFGEYGFYLHH